MAESIPAPNADRAKSLAALAGCIRATAAAPSHKFLEEDDFAATSALRPNAAFVPSLLNQVPGCLWCGKWDPEVRLTDGLCGRCYLKARAVVQSIISSQALAGVNVSEAVAWKAFREALVKPLPNIG